MKIRAFTSINENCKGRNFVKSRQLIGQTGKNLILKYCYKVLKKPQKTGTNIEMNTSANHQVTAK